MSGTTSYADTRRVAALVTVAVLALAGCSSGSDDEDPSSPGGASQESTASPTPDGSQDSGTPGKPDGSPTSDVGGVPVPVPDEVEAATEDGVDDYVSDVRDVLAEPSTEEEISPDAVTGAALEDLRNRVIEYEASGWRVVGEPRVVRHRVVRYYDDPERAVVRACVDNSDVRVVDKDGRTVPGSRPSSPRTLNIFTLVKVAGEWAVGEQRLATRPDC